MQTTNPISVTVKEVAETLGWNYQTAMAVKKRKSPVRRYQKFTECEQNLIQAKKDLMQKFQNN